MTSLLKALLLWTFVTVGARCDLSTAQPISEKGLYIVNTPLPCSGTVTAWKFCFVPPDTARNFTKDASFSITFAVFEVIDNELYLTLAIVEDSVIYVSIDTSEAGELVCKIIQLHHDYWFPVERGNVIGLCLDAGYRNQAELPMVIFAEDTSNVFYARTFCSTIHKLSEVQPEYVWNMQTIHVYAEIYQVSGNTPSLCSSLPTRVCPDNNTEPNDDDEHTHPTQPPSDSHTSHQLTSSQTEPSALPLISMSPSSLSATPSSSQHHHVSAKPSIYVSNVPGPSDSGRSVVNVPATAGVAVGALMLPLLLAVIAVVTIVFICLRKKKTQESNSESTRPTEPDVSQTLETFSSPYGSRSENHYQLHPSYTPQQGTTPTHEYTAGSTVALVGGDQLQTGRGDVYQELLWAHQHHSPHVHRSQNADVTYTSLDFAAMQQ